MKVIFDMDGVLADFCHGCAERLGTPRHPTTYEFLPADWADYTNHDFWANLPPIEAGLKLLRDATTRHDVKIMTHAVASAKGSHSGKAEWLKKHGITCPLMFVSSREDKKKWANGTLIDDHPQNVADWKSAGHPALLFPATYNESKLTSEDISWILA